MLSFISPQYQLHNPVYEFYRGEKVPCFESPQRLDFVITELRARGHESATVKVDTTEVMAQIHSQPYLNFLSTAWDQWLALTPGNAGKQPFPSVWPVRSLRSDIEPDNFIARLGFYSMDNGTPMAAGTWLAVKTGADTAASAAEHLSRNGGSVFCATRPPGHHAGKDFMGGYCFLNNAAIAAQTLRNNGCERVAIIDVDYHHGNGTQSIFYDRADVLFISLHGHPLTEFPFYLGYADEIGSGDGLGYNLNLPMPAGTNSQTWLETLNIACRRASQYQPDALVVSLGLDTFMQDPISTFQLQSDDFFRVGEQLATIGCPTLFVMEGGYATAALGTNTVNVLEGFEHQSLL